MIVLDEQLLGRGLELAVGGWYRGRVRTIVDLRPGSVIKDDAVPALLHRARRPTFVTINVSDFWRRVAAQHFFCLICFVLPDSRVGMIPQGLRALFRLPGFQTKADRMGKVVRVGEREIRYYTDTNSAIQRLEVRCLRAGATLRGGTKAT